MSPIIDLQRRMVEAGRIRAGEKSERGAPKKLDKWRLTSRDSQRLEHAARLWGGKVQPWGGRDGEYELYTEANQLPIMLIPGQEPTTWYELWTAGGCKRRCDGVHETISDSTCLCGEDRDCKPHTRLSVLLPDLPGIGSWLLSSTGWNAASELAGAADLLQRASAQGVLIPARLRLEQRASTRDGQTHKFAVPVIDLDVSFRELLGHKAIAPAETPLALPSGYTPIGIGNGNDQGVSIAAGLEQAEAEVKLSARIAPLPETDVEFEEEPVAVESADPVPIDAAGSAETLKPTKNQLKELDVLVGTLREAGAIQTVHLWSALATARNVDVEVMGELLNGRADGGWHWAPLRDDLNRGEASNLIDRLEKLEKNVGAVT